MGVVSHLHLTNELFFSVIQREIGKITTENFRPIAFPISYGGIPCQVIQASHQKEVLVVCVKLILLKLVL